MKERIRALLFRIWYWYVNGVDKNAEVLFMNYGYSDTEKPIEIDDEYKANRYPVQLYHHLAAEVELKNKDIVEVGCGRGGGLAYVAKRFATATAKGIDLDQRAVDFCSRFYKIKGMSFAQGDAQNLALADKGFDIVLNVESSHRYPSMESFLTEVHRILRPGGYFLFTDFRYDFEIAELNQQLNKFGLTLVKETDITKNVVQALELDDPRRRELIKRLAPKFLHKTALNFAGAVGSETYNQFASRKYVYMSYVLQKN